MPAKKKFHTVSELAHHTLESKALANQFDEAMQRKQVVKRLLGLRAARGMSQQDIADAMKCTQSRISKLEGSYDDDLSLGDLSSYLDVLDLQLGIIIRKKSATVVDEMNFHIGSINRILIELTDLAGDDKAMVRGVLRFVGDAAANLSRLLNSTLAKLLPHVQRPSHRVAIEIDEDECGFVDCSKGISGECVIAS
jgi:transcriptional regulator with XRE-family HTH domain